LHHLKAGSGSLHFSDHAEPDMIAPDARRCKGSLLAGPQLARGDMSQWSRPEAGKCRQKRRNRIVSRIIIPPHFCQATAPPVCDKLTLR
ncbi:MAG: hypothetical protein KGK16_01230, partial [Bradyrhizobium sp.]|nr:hypothetical protein [Bradyrhizobium sp.]